MRDRTGIVVDDGIATGATMAAALRATRRAGPQRLVLAVPVAPPDMGAIGMFYADFRQLSDEVIALLERAAVRASGTGA